MCIAFVYFLIYETKGLTLEQVDELYDEVKVARKSVGWRPTHTFREIRASIAGPSGIKHEHENEHEKSSNGVEYRAEHDST